MRISPEGKLGQLALTVPGALGVLQKRHLDYCCEGGRTLRDACLAAHLPLGDVMHDLEEATNAAAGTAGETRWEEASATDLARHAIDVYHVFTRDSLERITLLMAKVERRHGANHPELRTLESRFAELRAELVEHMAKEEHLLFPYFVALERAAAQGAGKTRAAAGSIRNPVDQMELEHATTGALIHELRRVAKDYAPPADACESYRALYRELSELEENLKLHIAFESGLLFPKALAVESEIAGRRDSPPN